MANGAAEAPKREGDLFLPPSIFDSRKGAEGIRSRGQLIERKIDFLESLAGKVSNRRSRRWLNDRLLIELVPRLDAEEIRGLFAPPPWGDNVPLSPFCMTNVGEWDNFRNIDMDKEASIIGCLEAKTKKREDPVGTEKMIALSAWHRMDRRTREAFRRSCLPDLVQGYEILAAIAGKVAKRGDDVVAFIVSASKLLPLSSYSCFNFRHVHHAAWMPTVTKYLKLPPQKCIRAFIKDSGAGDALVLHVQDSFHRLLLHGVCEFYDLVSGTHTKPRDGKLWKMTVIRKKKSGSQEIPPNITVTRFMKMGKDGIL